MKFRFLATLALASCASTPLLAQTDPVVAARLDAIEKALGITFWGGPQVHCDTIDKVRPAELPNGEYNAGYQQRRLNCKADQTAARLTILELKPNPIVVVTPPGTTTDPALITQIGSIESRLPPNNRTTQEYVNSAVASVQGIPGPPGPPGSGDGVGDVPGLGTGIAMNTDVMGGVLVTQGRPERAMRLLSNVCGDSIQFGHTHCDVTLPQLGIDFEQDGVTGFRYWKPLTSPAGPWDGGGKNFLIGGHNVSNGQRGPNLNLYSGHVGRGLSLGVSRNNANVVDNGIGDILISGTDSTNPVWVTLDGSLRRLVPCGANVCWQ